MTQRVVLHRRGGESVPDVCVFVDVEPAVKPGGPTLKHRLHTFRSGFCSVCWLSKGRVVDKAVMAFTRPEMFFALLDECRDRHKATWVFAHNLGYDLTLLGFWEWLERANVTITGCLLEDPPTAITIRWGRKLVRFVDVMNYWRLSIADLERGAFGVGHAFSSSGASTKTEVYTCERDVQTIETCILQLIQSVADSRCCSMRTTSASLAMATYLKCFLPRPLYISQTKISRRLEREAYYGGRIVQNAFGHVTEPVFGLDVNSLYPYVMQTHTYPCRLAYHPIGLRPGELRRAMRDYDAVARVSLCGGHYPYPVRSYGVTNYLNGPADTVLAAQELHHALLAGQVRTVHDCFLYEKADLFSGYVRHFYQRKAEADVAGYQAARLFNKMMLNSLHGKFAQNGLRWTPVKGVSAQGYYAYWWQQCGWDGVVTRMRAIAGRVEALLPGPDPRHAFPAISAAITANARVILEQDVNYAGRSNVLYCDTDSIHTVAAGRNRLETAGRLHPNKLGSYRVCCFGEDAYYWGHQHYRIGQHVTASGIKPTAREVADGIYVQDAMMGVQRTLETGNLHAISVDERVICRSAKSQYEQRAYVLAAGG